MPTEALFRVYYDVQGMHTHIRVFTGEDWAHHFAKCGELCMRNHEWETFRKVLTDGVLGNVVRLVDDKK